MVILLAHLTCGFDALRPGDHHRVASAARKLRVALEHLERRGERHRPSRGVVLVSVRTAQGVDVLHVLRELVGIAVEELVLVDRTVRRALTGSAVVRAVEDDRVLQLPGLLEVVDDPPDLGVGVLGKAGEDLRQPGEQFLLVGVERIPRPHSIIGCRNVRGQRIYRCQLGVLGQHALLDHPGQHPIPVGLVTVVELALVLVDVLLRSLVRSMIGPRTEPHVPGLGRVGRILVAQHPDRFVGQVFGEVVALFGAVGLFDEPVVLDEVGIPLVGLPAEESVEPVEALLQRPLRLAAPAGHILFGHVVVLAHPECAVAVVLKHLSDGGALRGQPGSHAGKTVGALGDRPRTVHVLAAAGQEAGARRRAQRRGVELGVPQPVVGQALQDRHVDAPAVGRPGRQSGVVVEHDEDVRRTVR